MNEILEDIFNGMKISVNLESTDNKEQEIV